jgi:hypothetical protein
VLDEKFIYGKQKTDKGQKHKKNLQADPEATIIKKLDLRFTAADKFSFKNMKIKIC